jgi:anti-anti-sigma regulatory factor
MVRLIIRAQTPEEVVLEVHGWVSGEEVGILEAEGTRLLGESQRLVLDLRGVRFMDREGLALLHRWRGDRLELRGASLFIRGLLEDHGLIPGGAPC